MINKYGIKKIVWNLLYMAIGMIVMMGLLNGRSSNQSIAAAEASATGQNAPTVIEQDSPSAPNSESWTSCTPINVTAFNIRIHVECAAAVGGIRFFAASTDNPAHAARILSALSTAHVAGRTLDILYDPDDTSGTEFGCAEADCRTIIAVGIAQ